MNQVRPNPAPVRHRNGQIVYWLLLGACLLLPWSGCATPHQRYQVLSIFFDGVPDPDAPVATTEPDTTVVSRHGAAAVTVYAHRPYADQKCNGCHVGAGSSFESFIPPGPRVCLNCHRGVERQYRVMHGPVVNVQCLFCHEPHEATVKHLLRAGAPALCLQCHNRADLPDKPAEHRDEKLDCLRCHVSHGGDRHGLLRQGAAAWGLAAATTAPATSSDTQPAPAGPASTQPARGP